MTQFLRTTILLFSTAASLLLASCTPFVSGLSSEALQKRGLKPGEGLIVGTYDFKSTNSSSMPAVGISNCFVKARGLDPGSPSNILIENRQGNGSVNIMNFVGGMAPGPFAIAVPAGNYEITGWTMTAPAYGGSVTVANRLPMKIIFQVKPGEATYIGKVNVLTRFGKNLLGLPVFGEGIMIITDQYEPDAKTISQNYPTIQRSKIQKSSVPKNYLQEMKRISETPRTWKDMFL